MMNNKLKPCPFCGATPYIICNEYRHNEHSYYVKCSNMECPVIPVTYENLDLNFAIDQWNVRRNNDENRSD